MMRWTQLPEFQHLPSDWEIVSLNKVATVTAGQSPPSERYNSSGQGLPFLQGNADFGERIPKATVWCTSPSKCCQTGDSLISVRAPVGEMNRADQEYAIGRGLAALTATDIDPDFLHFGMIRWRRALQRAGQGSTYEAVTSRHFRQMLIPRPKSRKEQSSIATIMSTLEGALKEAAEELISAQRMKTALMQQLFTKGVPGRHRDFRKIKRGVMPACWQMITISRIADVGSGVTLNQDRSPRSNGYRYLTVVNVQRDHIDLTEERYLELWPSEVPSRLLEKGDILVVEGHANSSEIGRAAMVDEQTEGMTFQNHLFRIRVNTDEVVPAFLLHSLNCERVRRHWNAICNTSSGLNTINRRQLRRLEIPKPPYTEQEEIVALIEASKTTIRSCEGKLSALTTLKRSLIQNLLTGKVRVNMGAQV